MREHFDDAWIEGYEHFIEIVNLPNDPDDRHVVAAGIACKAQYIVTDNAKHFPADELTRFDLESGTADKFLAGTFEHYRHEALAVLREHRRGLRSKPNRHEYLTKLRQVQLPLLSAHVKPDMLAL